MYTHDGAIGVAVGATIFVECQIGAPVIITLLVPIRKRRWNFDYNNT